MGICLLQLHRRRPPVLKAGADRQARAGPNSQQGQGAERLERMAGGNVQEGGMPPGLQASLYLGR